MGIYNVKMHSIDDKAKLSAVSRSNPELIIDYAPPTGTGQGYNSMELLLISLGSCTSTTLVSLIRGKLRKPVDGITVEVSGDTKDTYPHTFSKIYVTLNIRAKDLSEEQVLPLLKPAEEKLCPVWAMIRGNTEVDFTIKITE